MNRKIVLLAAAALATSILGVAAPAFAASHARDTFIKEQDLNGDGSVSKEEFKAGREKQFAGIDANHDGALSHDEYVGEFTARLTKRLAASTDTPEKREEERMRQLRQAEVRFGVLDTDKSGGITPAEFEYSGWRMFVTHDTNKDGAVSAADPVAEETN
ncbi:EF-hand domain-containing protein [Caulobacter sp. BK020]|uniref:EF-hand domain-containing protein n=1 Tax=Caulobacter sp. BK020 TaxID=2512117 RepID=UPI001050EBCE|nr:EF-hand domain-containing protein [Caulobacter sp. BK020]TCS16113.1 EF hand domain-containing protein [Caulobacter sp. BK020]